MYCTRYYKLVIIIHTSKVIVFLVKTNLEKSPIFPV